MRPPIDAGQTSQPSTSHQGTLCVCTAYANGVRTQIAGQVFGTGWARCPRSVRNLRSKTCAVTCADRGAGPAQSRRQAQSISGSGSLGLARLRALQSTPSMRTSPLRLTDVQHGTRSDLVARQAHHRPDDDGPSVCVTRIDLIVGWVDARVVRDRGRCSRRPSS
jgi:hypothetical protein